MQVIIRADYNPKLVMVAAVCGNATNILFDWLFVSRLPMGTVWRGGRHGAGALRRHEHLDFPLPVKEKIHSSLQSISGISITAADL